MTHEVRVRVRKPGISFQLLSCFHVKVTSQCKRYLIHSLSLPIPRSHRRLTLGAFCSWFQLAPLKVLLLTTMINIGYENTCICYYWPLYIGCVLHSKIKPPSNSRQPLLLLLLWLHILKWRYRKNIAGHCTNYSIIYDYSTTTLRNRKRVFNNNNNNNRISIAPYGRNRSSNGRN